MAVAALGAEGVTEISELHHLDRGYEGFVEKMAALGVEVRRVEEPAFRLP
jgi:UDP-N-acetylglucosamine 1-carboxyvinyltransferase